ncbi:EAL domain-containing protein [Azoarcus indigens]|uniref:Diguanylate cyclase/phosphodiesterase n=1 Tax=Azoarcus indigens TaxID=29545 RepID=A0A4R6DSF2_9RHOO|nr:EAL domain-containing protein [Azoarcus indigens]NMG67081.1 EAL domain-containing protein [Azoarcus indigens]TDN47248.1 diguanylate cyclase/phosphodiesterase [Azoarcus indigens]
MNLRGFILATSAAVGIVFLGGSWLAIGQAFDSAFSTHARSQANEAARLSFAAMYVVMSQGWSRAQAEEFLAGVHGDGVGNGLRVAIFRGPAVEARYGSIAQPAPGQLVRRALEYGESTDKLEEGEFRSVHALKAEPRCLACHDNVRSGDVLGAIEVTQPYAKVLQDVRFGFYTTAVPSLLFGLLLAGAAVWWVSRRIAGSVSEVERSLESINKVADLRHLMPRARPDSFTEIERMHDAIAGLAARLRTIAVDKDILLFEIGLLEKFVITSEVIRDWRAYVGKLLQEINAIVDARVLFSVFQIDDELFDIEIFWHALPDEAIRKHIEQTVHETLRADTRFSEPATLNIHHHYPDAADNAPTISSSDLTLRVKSFFVDRPKIGSIVGIGVHSGGMLEQTHNLVIDSILSTLLNVVGSIKAIHKYTRDLEYYATRDPLTDLYNQRVFWELLGYEVDRCRRHDSAATLLVIDLDNFKLINDHYGHATGDHYLQQFATAIRDALRSGDVLARYGGDEFVVILPETQLEQGYTLARRVLETTRQLTVDAPNGDAIRATVSIGLAVFPDHATSAKDLFLFADNMMYRAKNEGKERVVLPTTEDVMAVFRDVSEMSMAVLAAVNERRVIPFFQPIMAVQSGGIAAVEVLSRLEVGGQLMRADQFIEIAEKIGVIHRLDAIVIEAALEKVRQSDYSGYIFFNLSPRALVLAEFARTLRTVVRNSGIAPERIVFEITERDTVKNLSLLERFIVDLRSEGFRLAIDDFGSGFSSFHYLRRFPFDFLKIEGDFIANMIHSERDRIFVQSITELARALKIEVVAEFVESAEVLALLEDFGIDYAQGYHVGRPDREILIHRPQPEANY